MGNLNVHDLQRMLAVGAKLFYVVTDNERYTEGIVAQAAARMEGAGSIHVWTCTEGFVMDGA
ncbi:MAG TPA: hypothetical protein VLD55_10955, partial [Candidatus Sulfobium mesophilum]|nr:hypothetical protein [Candidatus Sulfobium mesophilum]